MPEPRELSVYVHFPWCLQKCPYCDFASATIRRPEVPHRAYADAVIAELRARGSALVGARLSSVFFGGGTPSLWAAAELGRVLAAIVEAFGGAPEALEVTAECNPSSLDAAGACALSAAGVNRLSIGVQSLDDAQLRFLGRLHDGAGALSALGAAQAAVGRVSGDLIFGLPEQPPAVPAEHAAALVEQGLAHVSAYSLTIEPGTQFGALHAKGRLPLAREDDVAEAYLGVERVLTRAGLEHYEVSSYARPGERARHNLHYWRGGAYLGLGAGAVGALDVAPGQRRRYRDDPNPEAYMARSATPQELEVSSEALGPEELVREQLMLGLRTSEGVSLMRCAEISGVEPLRGRERAVERAFARGDLVREGDTLTVPHARWLRLDAITAGLF